jgi:hypothetical protein
MRRRKTHAGSWEEKNPSHAIIDETTAPKTQENPRFWSNCYLVQPSIILQDQAITAKTSISGVMSKDPTWQDGQRGDMCPLRVPHHLGSHRVRHNNSSKMIKSIQPTAQSAPAQHRTDRAGTAASFGAVPPHKSTRERGRLRHRN